MRFRPCVVSYIERGQRVEARVDARSVNEAACLALKQWWMARQPKGPRRGAVLLIEAPPLHVRRGLDAVLKWLYETPPRTPEETELKQFLRALLAADRR